MAKLTTVVVSYDVFEADGSWKYRIQVDFNGKTRVISPDFGFLSELTAQRACAGVCSELQKRLTRLSAIN